MRKYIGKPIGKGIRSGPVAVIRDVNEPVKRKRTDNSQGEAERLKTACEESKKQLQKLYQKAVKEAGEAGAAIFKIHQMLLEDGSYLGRDL